MRDKEGSQLVPMLLDDGAECHPMSPGEAVQMSMVSSPLARVIVHSSVVGSSGGDAFLREVFTRFLTASLRELGCLGGVAGLIRADVVLAVLAEVANHGSEVHKIRYSNIPECSLPLFFRVLDQIVQWFNTSFQTNLGTLISFRKDESVLVTFGERDLVKQLTIEAMGRVAAAREAIRERVQKFPFYV